MGFLPSEETKERDVEYSHAWALGEKGLATGSGARNESIMRSMKREAFQGRKLGALWSCLSNDLASEFRSVLHAVPSFKNTAPP